MDINLSNLMCNSLGLDDSKEEKLPIVSLVIKE